MSRIISSVLIVIFYFSGMSAIALSAGSLTDPQIAHFLSTAEDSEIGNANLALKQTSNDAIRAFANETLLNHTSLKRKTTALLGKLKMNAEDNALSQSLAEAAAQHQQELSKLSGAAFDKAYAENELFYHVMVIGALETRLIPSMENGELKSFLEAGLAVFKDHQKNVQLLARNLKGASAGNHQ
jgi:putative membrane protein